MGLKDKRFVAAGEVDYIPRANVDCMYWIGGLQAFCRSSEQRWKAWHEDQAMCLQDS